MALFPKKASGTGLSILLLLPKLNEISFLHTSCNRKLRSRKPLGIKDNAVLSVLFSVLFFRTFCENSFDDCFVFHRRTQSDMQFVPQKHRQSQFGILHR